MSFLDNVGNFLQNRIVKPLGADIHNVVQQAPSFLSHIGNLVANQPVINNPSPLPLPFKSPTVGETIPPIWQNTLRSAADVKASLPGSNTAQLFNTARKNPAANSLENIAFGQGPIKPLEQQIKEGRTIPFTKMTVKGAAAVPLVVGSAALNLLPMGGEDKTAVSEAIGMAKNAKTVDEFAQGLNDAKPEVKAAVDSILKDTKNPINSVEDFFKSAKSGKGTAIKVAASGQSEMPEPPPTFDQTSKNFGRQLRTYFTGLRDSSAAQANQLGKKISNIVKHPQDQEALTIYREFKNKPQELEQFLNGTHPFYDQVAKLFQKDNPNATAEEIQAAKQTAIDKVKQLEPIIQKATNPTQALKRADQLQTDFFGKRLAQGKKQGFLDSKINPNEYINRILMKEPLGNESPFSKTNLGGGKMGRNFNFAKQRSFPTILHAIAAGKTPATLNAVDAMSLYGQRFGVVSATKQLLQTLKDSGMGKFGTEGADNIPKDWVRVGAGNRLFENSFASIDKATGKAVRGSNFLMAPPKVADALDPLLDKNGLAAIPGWQKTRIGQAYLKSVELGLSVFHMRALSLTGMNNMGYKAAGKGLSDILAGGINMSKTLENKMDSADFQSAEREFIKNGGTTSILGRTMEAYRGLKKSSLPEEKATGIGRGFQLAGKGLNVARGLPGIKQVDALAAKLSYTTFDVLQRYYKVADYSLQKASFLAKNPNATQDELRGALQDIAKEVNATYGGLQWENLGINQTTQHFLRNILLAPDWTFSNVLNAKYAVKGGAATRAARGFWVRSAATGFVASQLFSKMMSGQFSPDPTQVYLGKDSNGKDIYSNVFFAGAAGDAINTIKYGPVSELSAKMSPYARTAAELSQNRNYFGEQIVPRGMNPVSAGLRYAGELGANLLPIPFSLSGPLQMKLSSATPYTTKEYVLNALTGARTSHAIPPGMREIKTGPLQGKVVPAIPKTQNDILTQGLTGKINATKPSLSSIQRPNLIQKIENFIIPKSQANPQSGSFSGLQQNYLNSQATALIKQSLQQNPNTDLGTLQKQIQDSYPGVDFLNAYLRANGVSKANATKIDFNDHSLKGAAQRDQQLKAAVKIYGDQNVSQSFKNQAFKRMGISNDQVSYMTEAAQPESAKLDYFTNEAVTKDHQTLMQELVGGRQQGLDRSQLVSSGVLSSLYAAGYISKEEHTFLSKLSYTLDKNGTPVLSTKTQVALYGSGSSGKSLTARKTLINNIVKLTKSGIKAPKIAKALSSSGKTPFSSLGNAPKIPASASNAVRPLTPADIARLVKIYGKATATKPPGIRGWGTTRGVRVPHIRITGPKAKKA